MRNELMDKYIWHSRDRVAAGAAFLDKAEPGWDYRIDLYTLNIGRPGRCILGQLHGGYGYGVKSHRIRSLRACRYGLLAKTDLVFLGRIDGEYAALTAEWERVILARRERAVVARRSRLARRAVRAGNIGKETERREYEPLFAPDREPVPEPALPDPEPEQVPEQVPA